MKPDVLKPDVLKPDVLWVYRRGSQAESRLEHKQPVDKCTGSLTESRLVYRQAGREQISAQAKKDSIGREYSSLADRQPKIMPTGGQARPCD